ncbi:divergent polysaccharide deacetylase family protein [Rheinheimera sp.]|uniref:divergent polysaccharide deacetylase family protein n=1 Tax=Rheinheimera sp. TaxID=1869214 RepID=UPI002FDC8EFE
MAAKAQTLPPKVAIIIDDIGFQKADPLLIKLPYQLTFAVMPFTPQGKEMAELAKAQQKEVMLHMPMEAVAQNHLLGKGALRKPMSKAEVQQALHKALADVPQAVGVNNHMGSLYTSLAEPMLWTMQVMAERQLYFIDSKTTNRSAVGTASSQYQVKSRSRDIFLDNDKSYQALDRQFNQLLKLAKQQGSAIAIGHPYPETYRYLRRNLSRLKAEGIELVPVSQLLALPAPVVTAHRPKQPTTSVVATTATADSATTAPATESAASGTQVQSGKRQLKLSPKPEHNKSGVAGSGSVSLVYPATTESAITAESHQPEIQAAELLIWHPPYRTDLAGFSVPADVPHEPQWRVLLNTAATKTELMPFSGLLLLR